MADTNISSSVQSSCYGYHLLLARMNKMNSGKWAEENLSSDQGLFWFVEGLRYVYAGRNWQAREPFAEGMFPRAALTRKDCAKLQKAGVRVEWKEGTDNVLENSLSLARQFVEVLL